MRIFLLDGTAAGPWLIQKSNWTGIGLKCSRTLFPQIRTRTELTAPGIYILIGPGEADGSDRVYIGEGDPVLARLDQHIRQKDFWTAVIVFTSKDDNLNKAHVQYLEARLLRLARQANQASLDNKNTPVPPSLSEWDTAELDEYLAHLLTCLEVVGANTFSVPLEVDAVHEYVIRRSGLTARGYEDKQGFVVCRGSQAAKTEGFTWPSLKALRTGLVERQVLVEQDGTYVFDQDYRFRSPSAAAGTVLGRETNGRTDWKDARGVTLKANQDTGQHS